MNELHYIETRDGRKLGFFRSAREAVLAAVRLGLDSDEFIVSQRLTEEELVLILS